MAAMSGSFWKYIKISTYKFNDSVSPNLNYILQSATNSTGTKMSLKAVTVSLAVYCLHSERETAVFLLLDQSYLTFSFALLCPWPRSWRLSWYNLCSVWSLSLCCRSQSSLSSSSSRSISRRRLCSTSWRMCNAMHRCCSRTCGSVKSHQVNAKYTHKSSLK